MLCLVFVGARFFHMGAILGRCLVLCALGLTGCASLPPASPHDACRIFSGNLRWYRAVIAAEDRWNLPPGVALSFVYRESSYRANARPPRQYLLGVIPWGRISDAFGYAQITDAAWEDYLADTGKGRLAARNDFSDAIDFIGWYNDRSHRVLGIEKNDAYHLYIAYYEGLGGYRTGAWKNNDDVKRYAQEVRERSAMHADQLEVCKSRLKTRPWQVLR